MELKRLPRSNEFDILRLILASSVVFYHCHLLIGSPNILNFHSIPAVPMFIFVSGFLVSESLYFSTSIKKYFQKRIRRILPPYIPIVLFGGLFFWVIDIIKIDAIETNFFSLTKYYLYNFSFLNFIYPCIHDIPSGMKAVDCAVNGSLWSIKFEILFYLLLPLIFIAEKFSKFFYPILSISSLILLVTFGSISIYLRIFFCFLIGVGFSMSRQYWIPLYGELKIHSFHRLIIVILITILSGSIIPLGLALPLLTFICLFPTKDINKDFNANKFGDLSYGIYLIHFPIIKGVGKGLNLIGTPEILSPFLILFLSAIGAYLLYWNVEKKYLLKDNHYVISNK